MLRWSAVFLLIASIPPVLAQHKVDLRDSYERILAVVPMTGAGTAEDPRRPMYAPLPGKDAANREGILAFVFQIADDGKHALVEFVAADPAAFKDILADQSPDVKVFHKGKDKREDIEKEFKKHRKDFDFGRFGVAVP